MYDSTLFCNINELTQEELANKVNVRRETIARLENGKYNPSLELLLEFQRN
ncbi:helix-turn-helix transcriptional regulator [Terrisporobacter hibernicus]|uniref:helix-turn-helix transcriptional regulator n=1 Tax=Terrisporobacter TaxID=1505652 RepID=UPI003AB98F63